jgi:hypothetical protein
MKPLPELTQSQVVFNEGEHTYNLNGQRLSGITSLIHDVLGIGVYPQGSEYITEYAIPRAADYGSAVHKAIELYDKFSIIQTKFAKDSKFVDDEDTWSVDDELQSYIKNRRDFIPIENEYLISDNKRYATSIDNVWYKDANGGEIYLADTKTVNLQYYPGGEMAFHNYLSWQLSIEAYLFEKANPTLKVAGLYGHWLRHSESQLFAVDRIPDELVERLLKTDYIINADGTFTYLLIDNTLPAVAEAQKSLVSTEVINLITELLNAAKEAETRLDKFKTKLSDIMREKGIKSWECDTFKATLTADALTTRLDTKKLKDEKPEIYKEYSSTSIRKGGLKITLK